ncbi:uncharacterized protein LOC116344875 [Contarinia nasturtii]|uniref:uncharacterized protein LOC116344875 n=1 Tax=Contarinia nasturtii TaxID=265458 RepID=UPI0012D3CCD5|nr:uncharacterized protein LOC116344875 [Contarinia nasturtii]
MQYFFIRNTEHLLGAAYLWGWIYHDFAFLFPLKNPNNESEPMPMNSIAHGVVCILFLCMLRSSRDVHDYSLIRFNSLSIVFPFIVHIVLGSYTTYLIDDELALPTSYEHISPNWPQYMLLPFLGTFASIELLLWLKYFIRRYVSSKIEMLITVFCFFFVIFCFRVLFHLQISNDWLKVV